MPDYFRRRPVIKAMQFTGDIDAMRDWVAGLDTAYCGILNNIVVSAQGDGFLVNWDEGYLGAETMAVEGVLNDYLIMESCWFKSATPDEFAATFEPTTP